MGGCHSDGGCWLPSNSHPLAHPPWTNSGHSVLPPRCRLPTLGDVHGVLWSPRALYTYEDGSDDLKLAASGGGGLLELSGHFEIQKVMYGFCSVKEPQAVLPKYVLVNWVGEDVPDARKCACASHVAKIAEFFQGVDVIVNASSVEDIDPGAIGQRLSNGLARVSSPVLHRLRLREDENAEPVGTTYQKTDATVEMKRLNREQFWEQAKKEEELRKEEERKKALDARLRFEQERMEQERLEQEERERRYREREEQIEEHRRKQQSMEAEEARQRLKEQSIFGEQQEEDDRQQLRKSESEVEEAAAIIAQRPDNPREFFKQQERVASGSSDAISPGSHRTGSQSDYRKVSAAGCSPCESSPASTPLGEQRARAPAEETPATPKDSPSPSTQVAEPAVTEQHWPFPGPEDKAAEPPGDEPDPDPRPAWTAGADMLGDLVALEPSEPSPVPAVPDPQPVETPGVAEPLIELWQSDGAAPAASSTWPLPDTPAGPPVPPEEGTLLGLDELPEPPATFCDAEQHEEVEEEEEEEEATAGGPHPTGLGYQEGYQEGHEVPPITNGEMGPKDGTAGRGEQASEGYFSQSQEEEAPPPEEPSAKAPQPVFYNKPPEIDITCWDTDPLPEEEESFGGGL
ncbi:drebrin isoform X1 [Phasianus colchicus]|uniref:drebrin isoform X1 n=1 Tax=Phasianus colchicus TaxID=9054 RepID=UPI00129E8C73|nr:drebrin isoform X1 [Phasianus colchicus]